MTAHRTGRIPLVLGVFVAVLLFACSGEEQGPEGTSTASMAAPAPRPVPRPAPPAPPEIEPAPPAVEAPVEPEKEAFPLPVEEPAEPEGVPPEETIPAAAPEPSLDPTERVFTNKDLAKYGRVMEQFGFREDTVVVDLSAQPGSGPTVVSSKPSRDEMTEAEREKEILEVQAEIHRLNGELEYLRKRIPSLQNPFLPRAKLSESDQSAEAGLDNAERLERVKKRIRETESRLSELKRRYAELYKSHADSE